MKTRRYIVRIWNPHTMTSISKAVYAATDVQASLEFYRNCGIDPYKQLRKGWRLSHEVVTKEDFDKALWAYNYAPVDLSMRAG